MRANGNGTIGQMGGILFLEFWYSTITLINRNLVLHNALPSGAGGEKKLINLSI